MDDVSSVGPCFQGLGEFFGTVVIASQVSVGINMMIVVDPTVDIYGLFEQA